MEDDIKRLEEEIRRLKNEIADYKAWTSNRISDAVTAIEDRLTEELDKRLGTGR